MPRSCTRTIQCKGLIPSSGTSLQFHYTNMVHCTLLITTQTSLIGSTCSYINMEETGVLNPSPPTVLQDPYPMFTAAFCNFGNRDLNEPTELSRPASALTMGLGEGGPCASYQRRFSFSVHMIACLPDQGAVLQ